MINDLPTSWDDQDKKKFEQHFDGTCLGSPECTYCVAEDRIFTNLCDSITKIYNPGRFT